jgi:hypothetical protein
MRFRPATKDAAETLPCPVTLNYQWFNVAGEVADSEVSGQFSAARLGFSWEIGA